MYQVGDELAAAIADSTKVPTVSGVFQRADGKYIEGFNDNIIVADTLEITNQCYCGSSFEYGTAYAAELSMSMLTDIDAYSVLDGTITLSLKYEGITESLPLGVFIITEAFRKGKELCIKACDKMILFDTEISGSVIGTPYEILSYACEKCGVELATTQEQCAALVNGTEEFLVQEDDVQYWRDAIGYVSAMCCCFCTIDRNGKLRLQDYATTTTAEISNAQRERGAEIADYDAFFKGVKARFLVDGAYYTYKNVENGLKGLMLDLGDIPIVKGVTEHKFVMVDRIWEHIQNINYVPCTINIISNPLFELGDKIKNTNINNDANKSEFCFVQYLRWRYRKALTIKSVGDNYRLSEVKHKQSTTTAGLEHSISASKIQIKSYTNIKALTVTDKAVTAIELNYATDADCKPIFMGVMSFQLSAADTVRIEYWIDGVEDEERRIKQVMAAGWNTYNFHTLFDAAENSRYMLQVKIIAEGGATITIEKGASLGWVYAQGIVGAGKWDGTITVRDDFSAIPVSVGVRTFVAGVNTTFIPRPEPATTDNIGAISVSIGLVGFTDTAEGALNND